MEEAEIQRDSEIQRDGVNDFFQGHTAGKWQNSDLNPRLSDKLKFLHIAYALTLSSLVSCLPTQPQAADRQGLHPLLLSTHFASFPHLQT